MSLKMLRTCNVKVSVLGYFPLIPNNGDLSIGIHYHGISLSSL